ncbi:hypothetical protein ACF07D_10525 [Leucobacter sp. NPDC015123]|uniref:hypothetical protein n=1 Tax=Leucobacter sp. NPDC015123 TaxID=3364129 RepID=UPI0036F47241
MDNSSTTAPGRLSFRTVFGGTTLQEAYYGEPKRITRNLADAEFAYDIDLFLHIGGEVTPGDGATGLRNPRVSTAKRVATAQLIATADDAEAAPDASRYLRELVRRSAAELIARIAAKDRTVDEEAELAKLRPLFLER